MQLPIRMIGLSCAALRCLVTFACPLANMPLEYVHIHVHVHVTAGVYVCMCVCVYVCMCVCVYVYVSVCLGCPLSILPLDVGSRILPHAMYVIGISVSSLTIILPSESAGSRFIASLAGVVCRAQISALCFVHVFPSHYPRDDADVLLGVVVFFEE
jgi:hypothetical protein